MANTFTLPTWIKAKPHASAERQIGDSDPSSRVDVINRPAKGLAAVIQRLINTFFDGATVDLSDPTTLTAIACALAANTKLFVNAAGNGIEWASGVKCGTFTRYFDAGNGSVAYTGVGFTPSAIIIIASCGSTLGAPSIGFGTAAYSGNLGANYNPAGGFNPNPATIMYYYLSGSAYGYATLASCDLDGFTLTYTGAGSPSHDLWRAFYLALR